MNLQTGLNVAEPASPVLPRRIDVHCHYLPPEYRRAAEAAGHSHPDGMPGLPEWSPEAAVAMMDRQNIGTAMLSISSPGIDFGDPEAAQKLARYVNDEGARAIEKHPGRFGLFACLPLPHKDVALKEIAYAFDVLNADGVVVETSHRGAYLGDERFDEVFAELNRRRTVVFIHPTSPNCSGCVDLANGYPRPIIEFMFDTTQAVTNMLYKGTLDKFPNIRVIVPHAGATLPVLAERILGFSLLVKPMAADDFYAKLRRLYYDVAGFPVPHQLGALLQLASTDRVMYGSDWPFTPESAVSQLAKRLVETPLLDDDVRQRVFQQNAICLFPRLR